LCKFSFTLRTYTLYDSVSSIHFSLVVITKWQDWWEFADCSWQPPCLLCFDFGVRISGNNICLSHTSVDSCRSWSQAGR